MTVEIDLPDGIVKAVGLCIVWGMEVTQGT